MELNEEVIMVCNNILKTQSANTGELNEIMMARMRNHALEDALDNERLIDWAWRKQDRAYVTEAESQSHVALRRCCSTMDMIGHARGHDEANSRDEWMSSDGMAADQTHVQ